MSPQGNQTAKQCVNALHYRPGYRGALFMVLEQYKSQQSRVTGKRGEVRKKGGFVRSYWRSVSLPNGYKETATTDLPHANFK